MTNIVTPRQLPLDLVHTPGLSRDELVVSPSNAVATGLIDRWPEWPASLMILAGPAGSGKTHLGTIWAQRANATCIAAANLSKLHEAALPTGNVLVDSIELNAIDETALFHLINSTRESGHSLLITSRLWPTQWPLRLPDLISRLKSAPVTEISEPDDALLSGVIVKLFADRQIAIDPAVVSYLVSRIERSLGTAQNIVDRLDRAALETMSRITRPLAASVLTMMDSGQTALDF